MGALLNHLHGLKDVRTATAETASSNGASERVLEKLGFVRSEMGWSAADGDLTRWSHQRA